MAFYSRSRGRFHVHLYPTNKFRTRHFSLKVIRPLTRQQVTATAILPHVWMEGTMQSPSAKALMQRADELYGTAVRSGISKRGNRHVIEVYASSPEEFAISQGHGLSQQVQALCLEVMTNPLRDEHGFVASSVERERTLHKKRIESIYDDKIAYSLERSMELACDGEVAGLRKLGYVEDLPNLTGESLWAVHNELVTTADIHMYSIGAFVDVDTEAEQALAMLEAHFPTSRSVDSLAENEPLLPRTAPVNYVSETQDVHQGKLNLVFRTGQTYRSSDYFAMMMMNGVLGGFPHSKLFENVREKASLAYYASSQMDSLTGLLTVQTGIEMANYEQALSIVLEQVQALQRGEISDDEHEFTRQGIRNQYVQLEDSPPAMIDVHFLGILAGVKPREVSEVLHAVDAVTKEDIMRAANSLQLDTVYFLRDEEGN